MARPGRAPGARRWTASPTRASATPSRCGWPRSWRRSIDDVAAPSIATPRSCERTPGQPRGHRGARAPGGDPDRALPHRRRSSSRSTGSAGDSASWSARWTRSSNRSTTATERVRILREMAEIHQRLGAPRPGVRLPQPRLADRRRVGRDAGRDGGAGGLARGLHGAAGRDAARRAPSRRAIPTCRRSCGAMTARLLEEPLGRRRATPIEAWRVGAVGAARRSSTPSWRSSACCRRAARSSELVEVLEKHLEITTDAAERKAIAKRIAVLYEDALKQREQAVRAWETVLEIDAGDGDALDALAQLHLAGGVVPRAGRGLRAQDASSSERPRGPAPAVRAERAPLRREADRAGAGGRAAARAAGRDARRRRGAGRSGSRSSRARSATPTWSRCWTRARRARATPAARDELAFRAARLTETELSDVEGGDRPLPAASWRRSPDHAGRARGAVRRSRAATTTACRRSRCWSRSCARRATGTRSSSCSSCAWRSRTRSSTRLAILGEIARIEEMERRDIDSAFAAWARALTEEATEAAPRAGAGAAGGRDAATGSGWPRSTKSAWTRRSTPSLQRSLALRLADAVREASWPTWRARRSSCARRWRCRATRRRCWRRWSTILRRQGEHAELAEILAREAEVAGDPARAGRLPDGAGRGPPARRSTTPTARWPPTATRSSATRSTRGRARALHDAARSRRDARGRAGRAGAAGRRRAATIDELLALYEQRAGAARRPRRARALAAQDRRGRADQIGSPQRALDALGRALKEEPMPGARARRSRTHRGRGQAARRRGAAKIEAVLDATPSRTPRASWRCARRASTTRRGDRAGGRAPVPRVLEGDAENVDALHGAGGAVPARRATSRAWRRSSSGARRPSWIRRRASAG